MEENKKEGVKTLHGIDVHYEDVAEEQIRPPVTSYENSVPYTEPDYVKLYMPATVPQGKKFDQQKPRVDLLPPGPIMEVAKVMGFGAGKYGDNNWRNGLDWNRCYGAILRHLFAWWDGETNDPESGINHLAHAACSILFLLQYAKDHPEMDNRPRERSGY